MASLIEADTRLDAWMVAADHLLQSGPLLNLILSIESPAKGGTTPAIDDFLAGEGEFSMHTVADTIFPSVEYRRRGIRGVLDFYPEKIYPAIKKHPSIRWGTYAHRLVRRHVAGGRQVNPLEQMIDKMKSELSKRGPKRSCYELGVAEGEYDLAIYSPAQDGKRRMGGPCLSHLSFKLFDKAVHLSAFYRSHDYSYKTPGNLLGLARLQACVAHETGQDIGTMTVHSSYAFLDGPKGRMRKLLKELGRPASRREAEDVVAH